MAGEPPALDPRGRHAHHGGRRRRRRIHRVRLASRVRRPPPDRRHRRRRPQRPHPRPRLKDHDMNDTTKDELAILHGLRVQGMTNVRPLTASTGYAEQDIQRLLDDAVSAGHARSRTGGRVQGYMLTSAGRERHEELRRQHVTEEEKLNLSPAYDAFLKP